MRVEERDEDRAEVGGLVGQSWMGVIGAEISVGEGELFEHGVDEVD